MKITQEQFDELPQLDRIEFRQKLNNLYLSTGICWIVSFIVLGYSFLMALIMFGYTFWRSFKYDKDYVNKLEEQYFNSQVKRKIREVKNK